MAKKNKQPNKKEVQQALDDLFDWDAPMPLATVKRERMEKLRLIGKRNKKGKRKKRLLPQAEKDEIVRGVMRGNYLSVSSKSQESQGRREAKSVAYHYAQAHARFYNHRMVDWRSRFDQNPSAVGCFSKAAITAELSEVTVEDFIKAQFWWFNDRQGRAPSYRDIAGPNARNRVIAWTTERAERGVPKTIVHRASQGYVKSQMVIPKQALQYEISMLKRMTARWGSEEQVWELFGQPGNEEVFPDEFKRIHRIWRDMYMKWFEFEYEIAIVDKKTQKHLTKTITQTTIVQCLVPQDWAKRYVSSMKPPIHHHYPPGAKPQCCLWSVRILREDVKPADHRWKKVDTPIPGKTSFRLWDRVKCIVCGVKGRRDLADNTVSRCREFSDSKFSNCGKALKILKGERDEAS